MGEPEHKRGTTRNMKEAGVCFPGMVHSVLGRGLGVTVNHIVQRPLHSAEWFRIRTQAALSSPSARQWEKGQCIKPNQNGLNK